MNPPHDTEDIRLYFSSTIAIALQTAMDDVYKYGIPEEEIGHAVMTALAETMISIVGIEELKKAINISVQYIHRTGKILKNAEIITMTSRELIEKTQKK